METIILTSKLIESAYYDEASSRIFIKLINGKERSIPAPRSMYENLITADSPGWYYTRHIRPLIKH